MTEPWDSLEEPTAEELAAVESLLARVAPDAHGAEDLWAEAPDWLEDSIVEAIGAEAAQVPASVTTLEMHRSNRLRQRVLATAAAAVLLVAGVILFANRTDRVTGVEVAMVGTEAAPTATASAELFDTPAGLKILLDVEGLDGAPADFFYEAWISDGSRRVSAGTFHLRNGDNEIELWAGVVDPAFNTISVTLEPLDGVAESSGDVRLRGTFDLADA